MLDLYINISNGLDALQTALKISIQNADNFNTPGFKATLTSFMSQAGSVESSGMVIEGTKSTNPIEVPGSMVLGSTTTDWSQGNIGHGGNLDLAVSGEGFFALSYSAIEATKKVYTRNGSFIKNSEGTHIVDPSGRKLYGYKTDKDGKPLNSTLVPIETDGNLDVGFSEGGILMSNFQSYEDAAAAGAPLPERNALYRVALTTFSNKNGLLTVSGGAWKPSIASGSALEHGQAGEGVYGDIFNKSLESSNIDVAFVALQMALLNRGFSAIQGVIDDVNKVFNNLISKLS